MRHLKDFQFIEAVIRAGSIRKAAEDMNITASALNRRINRFEEDFGYEIFERLPRGVRLNPAGELMLHHIRAQRSDFVRLQSQVADLSGVRRGHVSIACSQALLPYFLPEQIARYRSEQPGVTFGVNVRDRLEAESAPGGTDDRIAIKDAGEMLALGTPREVRELAGSDGARDMNSAFIAVAEDARARRSRAEAA